MGIFFIFGGELPPQGGGCDYLHNCHSLDEARAWLAGHPQEWADIFVWREGKLEFEESRPGINPLTEDEPTTKGKKKGTT